MKIRCPNCARIGDIESLIDFEDFCAGMSFLATSIRQLKICRSCGILFDPKYCTETTKDAETDIGTGRLPETDTFTDTDVDTDVDTDTLASPHET